MRIRTIKPEFFLDEDLARHPPLERLLFEALWCQADRLGRLEDKPGKIKAQALPYDECNVDAMLTALAVDGYLIRYEVERRKYIQIRTFEKHQRPNAREAASILPPSPPLHVRARVRTRLHVKGNVAHVQDHVEREGKVEGTGKGREGEGKEALIARDPVRIVVDHWQRVMRKPKAALDSKRRRAVEGRLQDGYSVEDLCLAIDGCAADPWHQGSNDRGRKFNDIELICRDAKHVDDFLEMVKGRVRPMSPLSEHNRRALGLDSSIEEQGLLDAGDEDVP